MKNVAKPSDAINSQNDANASWAFPCFVFFIFNSGDLRLSW